MLRVLLIDDYPDDCTLVIRQLQQEFSEVEVEQIIDQASFDQALRENRFDIAITDYRLMWSDGLTVLQQLKAVCPICPVIMFTNSAMQEEAIEAMKAGLDDYIIKSPRHYIRLATAARLALERAADRHKATHLEMRLQRLLNHLQVGIFRATLDGYLVEANATFLKLLGVQTLEEAQAMNLRERFSPPQIPLPKRSQLLEHPSSSALAEQWLGREVQLQPVHGEPQWVAVNQTITAFGQEFFIEGLIEDISDRKALETALQQQAEALAQANRLKDEFLSTIYHELRTPLNPILGWSKLLRAQPTYDQSLFDRALAVIERNAVKQASLIEDILDVSQIIQGRLRLNLTLVNLEETLAVAVEGIRAALESKSIELSIHLDLELGLAWGDKNRIQQIFWNLLLNAVKFTPATGQIQVRLTQHHQMVKFQVQDTGIGISPEFLPHVFDRFSQADGSITRTYGGMGLGLAIVRHLVELHGGTVKAESPGLGQGATLTVEIPLATVQRQVSRDLTV
jgi:PAS domain S-box-containing protein